MDARTKDGFDIQMQANHLSHFLLTSLVFDLLEAAASAHGEARVISHSSGARHSPDVVMRRDGFEKAWYDESPLAGDLKPMAKWARYQQSKRANLAFTYALADLIDRKGAGKVKAVCAHPGATNSGLQSHTDAASWLDRFINGLAVVAGQSTEDGCLPLALATLQEGANNGDFFGPKGLTGNAELLNCEREWGAGYDKAQLEMLWTASNAATGAGWV
uniref:Protochlorophyllide reductase n=1 Tax=Haptolina ericina TaxID=156174 RepID=A0A7S3BRV1_9EUKA